MEEEEEQQKEKVHFVVVHGACHGGWSWFKIKPRLEELGHRVTVLDLAAAGINMKKLDEVLSFEEYSYPLLELMASIPPNEKVILVGYSLDGLSLALAMDKYPHKISVAVLICSRVHARYQPPAFLCFGTVANGKDGTAMAGHPVFIAREPHGPTTILALWPQDVALATLLMRPVSLFLQELSRTSKFSEEAYGRVKRVYIVCKEDKIVPEEFQRWMAENGGAQELLEIKGADHMAMFSKPQLLSQCLLDIAASAVKSDI